MTLKVEKRNEEPEARGGECKKHRERRAKRAEESGRGKRRNDF